MCGAVTFTRVPLMITIERGYVEGGGMLERGRFLRWHRRQTEWWLARLGLSYYAALWVAYLKGVVTALVALWLLGLL